jgi:hypothetical protein
MNLAWVWPRLDSAANEIRTWPAWKRAAGEPVPAAAGHRPAEVWRGDQFLELDEDQEARSVLGGGSR